MKKTLNRILRMEEAPVRSVADRRESLRLLPALACADAGLCRMLSAALPAAELPFVPAAVLLFLVGAALLLLPPGKRTRLLAVGSALLLLAGLAALPLLRPGLLALANCLRRSLCAYTGRIVLPLEDADPARLSLALWAVLSVSELLLCSGRWGAVLCVLPYPFLWAVGFVPLDWGAVLFLLGCAALFLSLEGAGNARSAALCLLLALAPALALSPLLRQADGSDLRLALHAFRYDSSSNSMPEGRLERLGRWRAGERDALALTLEQPQKLYLRGYTGEKYTGERWEALSGERLSEWSESFYSLYDSGFYPLSSIAGAARVTDSLRESGITVQNLTACRARLYLPYALAESGLPASDAIGGSEWRSSERAWSGTLSVGSVPDWFTLRSSLSVLGGTGKVGSYLRREALYRRFVESEYLDVPPETGEQLRKLMDLPEGGYTLSEIKDCILTVLQENLAYDEGTSLRTAGRDFVACTLEEGSGYSVHYATLAALMLRTMGVPARYVEGYFLPAEEAAGYSAGEEIRLKEKHAHAWAEYYLDGVGWIPFETTPGYIDDEELNAGPGTGEEQERIYEPPETESIAVSEPQTLAQGTGGVRISRKSVGVLLLVLLLLAAAALVLTVLRRRKALQKTLQSMNTADDREAILLRYAYAQELLKHCRLNGAGAAAAEQSAVREINLEALYSRHPMSREQREQAERFSNTVLAECVSSLSPLRRLKLRWWDALIP